MDGEILLNSNAFANRYLQDEVNTHYQYHTVDKHLVYFQKEAPALSNITQGILSVTVYNNINIILASIKIPEVSVIEFIKIALIYIHAAVEGDDIDCSEPLKFRVAIDPPNQYYFRIGINNNFESMLPGYYGNGYYQPDYSEDSIYFDSFSDMYRDMLFEIGYLDLTSQQYKSFISIPVSIMEIYELLSLLLSFISESILTNDIVMELDTLFDTFEKDFYYSIIHSG